MARRKKYKNIYSKKNRKTSFWKISLVIVGLFVITLVGYAVSGPLLKFINGELSYNPADDPKPSSDTSQSTEDESEDPLSDQNSGGKTDATLQEQENIPQKDDKTTESLSLSEIKGVFMPTSILLDDALFNEFVTQASEKGFDSIVFELKDSAGHINYDSQNESVITAGAKIGNPVDLKVRTQIIKDAGINPIAKIYAFQDSVSSFVFPDACVWYQAEGTRWVDNYIDRGGKPWLNPESLVAQTYIKEIALEIVDSGVDKIIVDGIMYPTGVALELAYYGERSKTDKFGVLNDFSKDMEKALGDKGGMFIPMFSALTLLNDNPMQYGGNPLKTDVSSIGVSIYPGTITDPLDFDGEVISVPASMPRDTTALIVKAILKNSPKPQKNILPFIQYYDGYENGDYASQIEILEENNIFCYVLYNEQGVY